MAFSRSQVHPIGLDVGFDSVKMLQLASNGPLLSLVASAREALPPEVRTQPDLRMPAATQIVRRLFKEGHFSGRRVVAALPREIVHVKNLRLPMMGMNELQQAVQFEAKNIFPFETDKAYIRFLPAGEVRQGVEVRQEVIVVAAKHDEVTTYVEWLHHCGAIVESLDMEQCALFRSLERFIRRREDEQDVHVIIDIGARRSQVIIGKGRDITFLKTIEIGAMRFNDAVSKKLGITVDEARALRRRLSESLPEDTQAADAARRDPVRQAVFDATRSTMEDLGREIGLCLRYYSVTFRGHRPNKVRLLGGEASNPQLQAVLNSSLGVPVEPYKPLYCVDLENMKATEREGTLCEWGLACGLALRMTTGFFGPPEGKRQPGRREGDKTTVSAEVVDIDQAVEQTAADPTSIPAPFPNRTAKKQEREEVHA